MSNFTVFTKATFEFSPQLNVIVGDNGAGKSHVLKLGYSLAACSYSASEGSSSGPTTKDEMQKMLAEKLLRTMRPDFLGRLVSRQQGRNRGEVSVDFVDGRNAGYGFNFASNSRTEVKLDKVPSQHLQSGPIYFPTREVLSIFPGFAQAYRTRELEFDETYYDLVLALEARPLKGKRPNEIGTIIEKLEQAIEGRVLVENGRFYLVLEGDARGKIEIPLVAEGIRKLAMLAYLLINGELRDRGTLFWDEPETNLNPRLIKSIAEILVQLARNGIQVIAATHSLFLLRELEIQRQLLQSQGAPLKARYFALDRKTTDEVKVHAGDTLDSVEPVVALDEDLKQSDRYLELP
ncbi:MAG: AAA family ATPase [Stagnimonas sp.]|nr:AAA family ATPase [Stagnimonas sp.]